MKSPTDWDPTKGIDLYSSTHWPQEIEIRLRKAFIGWWVNCGHQAYWCPTRNRAATKMLDLMNGYVKSGRYRLTDDSYVRMANYSV